MNQLAAFRDAIRHPRQMALVTTNQLRVQYISVPIPRLRILKRTDWPGLLLCRGQFFLVGVFVRLLMTMATLSGTLTVAAMLYCTTLVN